jgi:hypothetical protein
MAVDDAQNAAMWGASVSFMGMRGVRHGVEATTGGIGTPGKYQHPQRTMLRRHIATKLRSGAQGQL